MITVFQIHFGEELCSLDSVLEFLHQVQRVSIGHSDSVDASVFDAQSEAPAMRFWYEEDWGAGT